MQRFGSRHQLWWVIVALLLVIVFAGCQVSGAGQGARQSRAAGTATTTNTLVAYATPLATAAPTNGWTIYHDHRFPLQMPIPPGWQVGTASWPQQGAGSCAYYDVAVFPPNVTPLPVEPLAETNQEFIDVSVSLTCPPIDLGSIPDVQPEATPVVVSGVRTTVYDQTLALGFKSSAVAPTFGGLEYTLGVISPPSTAARDISVFRAILQGFQYMGR